MPTDQSPPESAADATPERVIDDVRAIRALAHPMRLRIIDILRDGGEYTATQISELVGESPANCAFHLRTLGRYGYIEEAPGGPGRSRPWKSVPRRVVIDSNKAAPEDAGAIRGVRDAFRASDQARQAAWDLDQLNAPKAWQDAAFEISMRAAVTVEELAALSDEITAVIDRFAVGNRERPEGAATIHFSASAFPTSIAQLTSPSSDS